MSVWSEFEQQITKCYMTIIKGKPSIEPWQQGFTLFQNIVEIEADEKETGKKLKLEDLENKTKRKYDFTGFLQDYLDQLESQEMFKELLEAVEYLLQVFDWSEGDYLDLKFLKSQSLCDTQKVEKAYEFCKKWINKEPCNQQAGAALIYTCIHMKNYEEAEAVVKELIDVDAPCTEENEMMYVAAAKLYEAMGNKEMAKKLEAATGAYGSSVEQEMVKEFFGGDLGNFSGDMRDFGGGLFDFDTDPEDEDGEDDLYFEEDMLPF